MILATDTVTPELLPAQLPNHKVKYKRPMQRACNENNPKGKLCGGHLKRWFYSSDVKEQGCGDVKQAWGKDAEVYRCEHCKTLYLPNPEDLGGRNVAGYGSISDFGFSLPPKETAAKSATAAEANPKAPATVAAAATPSQAAAAKVSGSAEPIPTKAAPAQNPTSASAQDVKSAPLKDPKEAAPKTAEGGESQLLPAAAASQVETGGAIAVDAVKTVDTVKRVEAQDAKNQAETVSPPEPAKSLDSARNDLAKNDPGKEKDLSSEGH